MTSIEQLRNDIEAVLVNLDSGFLNDRRICDFCLGRVFAKIGIETSNKTRGELVRTLLSIDDKTESEDCWVCDGVSDNVEMFAKLVVRNISEWEFDTYLIGSKFDSEIVEKEETLWSEFTGEYSEPIKSEFNREVGKQVYDLVKKEVSFSKPDIVAIVDTRYDSVDLQISSLYIYGRYRKLIRGIPQTRWPCRACLGKGCERCNNTGKMYQTSVEEIIAHEVMKDSSGSDHKFHGMGREDVDAKMLGRGRPFVLEIRKPKKRSLPLQEIENRINKSENGVEVTSFRPSNNEEIVALKEATPDKKYRITISLNDTVTEEKLKEVVLSLGGKTIAQKTPTRVLHRRADKTRFREIKNFELCVFSLPKVVLEVTAQTGTYVKELIHGDDGRTVPSLAGELEVGCTVDELDVLDILDDEQKGV